MKRWLAILILGGALGVSPMLAQEAEGGSAGMEIWKVVNFFILFGILGYLAKKHVAPLLTARSQEIRDGLAAGEKAQAEAQAKAKAVDARLHGLEEEIAGMRLSAHAEGEQEAARLKRDAQTESTRIREHAAVEMEFTSRQARLDVQRHAAKLAVDLAEKKVRERMSAATQDSLVGGFVMDLARRDAR